jgi:quinate dehydrogenase
MHNYVVQQLSLPWTFTATECPTLDSMLALFRAPTFAGGVVTMPYKVAIIPHLDGGLDVEASRIRAVNCVYKDQEGRLRGGNTDWRGIRGCLADGAGRAGWNGGLEGLRGKAALLVGAGGAARAAVYVLARELSCGVVYVVNRDEGEVEALRRDVRAYEEGVELVHLRSLKEAERVAGERGLPRVMVGTVPDFEPKTAEEVECAKVVEYVFARGKEEEKENGKAVVLDMCFKPRRTRTLKLAEKYGWIGVEGTGVIGHQIHEQYRLWTTDAAKGESPITPQIQEGAWRILNKAAEASTMIN